MKHPGLPVSASAVRRELRDEAEVRRARASGYVPGHPQPPRPVEGSMPDKPWKRHERETAALVGGRRYWANAGEAIDVESAAFVVQCKLVQRCSLPELEALALEAERQGQQKAKIGMVAIKRSGRRGPRLIVLTESQFRAMSGPLPEKRLARDWNEGVRP